MAAYVATLTCKLVSQTRDLAVGVTDDLVHLRAQCRVLVGQASCQKLLVDAAEVRVDIIIGSDAAYISCVAW